MMRSATFAFVGLASLSGTDALVIAPIKAGTTPSYEPVMQFDFFKKSKPEPEPAPPPKPVSTAGGGLFGAFKNSGGGRKTDGGALTSGFRRQPAAPGKGKKAAPEPEKWIEGRSGPQVNPAWTAWSKNR